jgi:uncharacterized protein YbjT (DUF2867 family)
MKVLVTGGTGFVGRHVVDALCQEGHEVHVLARQRRPIPPGTTFHPGSVLDPDTLPGAVHGCDAVVHLVGIITENREQTFEKVHVEATRNMLHAAIHARVPRWLHMSALGTRPNAVARYHQTKWAAEELVRASPLAWTLFRPSLIYGPGDGFINMFHQMSRWSPVIPLPGCGRPRFQPIPVADVATCFARALGLPGTIGHTYDLVGPHPIRLGELVSLILKISRRSRVRLPVPLTFMKVPAKLGEWVYPALAGKGPPLNSDQLIMLAEDNTGDPEPMRTTFGVHPPPLEDGIRCMLER